MRTILFLVLAAALAAGGCVTTIKNIGDRNLADEAMYVENDPETAYQHYEKAARKGDAEAQHELAKMYRNGVTVKKDYRYAKALEENSAAQEFPPAMRTLGFHLVTGLYEVEMDARRGLSLLNAAAEEDDAGAHYLLGRIYAHGTPDILRNASRAAHHFTLAEEEGYTVDPELKNVSYFERANLPPLVRRAPPASKPRSKVTKAVILDVQRALKDRGFYTAEVDGILGKGSVRAIKAFQKSAGLEPTGAVDDALLRALNLKHL